MQKTYAERRYWLITYNNPPEDWKSALKSLESKWAIGQLEQGENGTKHIQALLYFPDRVSNKFWTGKKVFAKAIPKSDAKQTATYCTKEDTRIEGPWHFGACPFIPSPEGTNRKATSGAALEHAIDLVKQGRLKEVESSILVRYVKSLEAIATLFDKATSTTEVRGIYIQGPPGTGKSTYARQFFINWLRFYAEVDGSQLESELLYIKSQNKWWDGYSGQPIVVLEDFDEMGVCLGHLIKIFADMHAAYGEKKGSQVPLKYIVLIFTSNFRLRALFKHSQMYAALARRFQFLDIPNLGDDPQPLPFTTGYGQEPEDDNEQYFKYLQSE